MHLNEISGQVVDCALRVHTRLGPGLLESCYEACLAYELTQRGLRVQTQVLQPVIYDAVRIDVGYKLDLVVQESVIVELKAVETILPIHKAQIITYLKLSDKRVGIPINFNVVRLKDGIHRFANKVI